MAWESRHYKITELAALADAQPRPKDVQLSELLTIAIRFHEQGNLPEAETLYREILRADFDFADAWHLLGILALQANRDEVAVELISEAIAINPQEPIYHNNLGNVYRKLGELEAAQESYDRALFLKPDYVGAHYNRATILKEQGKLEAAAASYRRALRLRPDDHEVLNDFGSTLRRQGDLDAAIECYRKALRIKPEVADIYVNLGLALEQQGDVDAAIHCYQKALELDPAHAQAHLSLVELTGSALDGEEKLAKLLALLENEELSDKDAEYVHWALGKVYHDCGLFQEAFRYYKIANSRKCKRSRINFDRAYFVDETSRIIATYPSDFFQQRQGLGSESELPVFMIGVPRAGKSLAERLISDHPHVHEAGEIEYFDRLSLELSARLKTSKPYPECASLIDLPTAHSFAEEYVQELRRHSSEARRITNTIPNFTNVGLIAVLFPKARIIHLRRHPLDVCLSIYFKSFAGKHPYAYDLEDITVFYKQYEQLMAHWYSVLPNRIVSLDYEEMVTNEDESRRKLLEWCGLEWDKNALSTSEAATDGDKGMGRRSLSGRYVGRWKDYDEFIAPLKRGLGYS